MITNISAEISAGISVTSINETESCKARNCNDGYGVTTVTGSEKQMGLSSEEKESESCPNGLIAKKYKATNHKEVMD